MLNVQKELSLKFSNNRPLMLTQFLAQQQQAKL